jgi:hypothetical protein
MVQIKGTSKLFAFLGMHIQESSRLLDEGLISLCFKFLLLGKMEVNSATVHLVWSFNMSSHNFMSFQIIDAS